MTLVESNENYLARRQYGPTADAAPLRGARHPLARPLLDAVRAAGRPVSQWSVINALAKLIVKGNNRVYQNRGNVRLERCFLLTALAELCFLRLVYRHGAVIAAQDFPIRVRPRRPRAIYTRISMASVAPALSEIGGSNAKPGSHVAVDHLDLSGQSDHVMKNSDAKAPVAKTQSVPRPTPESLSAAARTLARLPRDTSRKWTGFVAGRRQRGKFSAIAPDGRNCEVRYLRRGVAFVVHHEERTLSGRLRRYPVSTLTIPQNRAAALLGALKRGVKEHPSAAKAASSRRNGSMPCAAGKRRGRPRKALSGLQVTTQ